MKKIEELDQLIENHAIRWKKNRISKVSLAVLRLALYEMGFEESIPESVSINEAVELAKRFGGEEDPRLSTACLGLFPARAEGAVGRGWAIIMGLFLGIDTSNYTTSMALLDSESGKMIQQKAVASGKRGAGTATKRSIVSTCAPAARAGLAFCSAGGLPLHWRELGYPPDPDGGRILICPVFGGESQARTMGAALQIPVYPFFPSGRPYCRSSFWLWASCLAKTAVLAFHFSGGTSEALLVRPEEGGMDVQKVAGSLDLKAGQAVDRVGQMLGLPFPAGPQLEQLAAQSTKRFPAKPAMKGCDCSLSGVENRCRFMLEKGEAPADIAQYCLDFLTVSLCSMTEALLKKYRGYPLLYAGGVMSNRYIRQTVENRFGGVFVHRFIPAIMPLESPYWRLGRRRRSNMPKDTVLSVSQLNRYIKSLFEQNLQLKDIFCPWRNF